MLKPQLTRDDTTKLIAVDGIASSRLSSLFICETYIIYEQVIQIANLGEEYIAYLGEEWGSDRSQADD